MTTPIDRFHAICADVNSANSDPYAVCYAQAGMHISRPHEAHTQLLYIQSNLRYWRGEQAREVKARIKSVLKELAE